MGQLIAFDMSVRSILNANIFDSNLNDFWAKGSLSWLKNIIVDNSVPSSEIVDGYDYWLMPGFIDSHLHICGESDTNKAKDYRYNEAEYIAIDRGIKNAKNCLRFGITSVRDMGNFERRGLKLKRYFEEKGVFAPRIYTSGNLITGVNGHASDIGIGVRDKMLMFAVREEISNNVDFIKIINDPLYFSFESIKNIVIYAKENGKKVACHAYTPMGIKLAQAANVNSIEHSGFLYDYGCKAVGETFIVPTCVAAKDVVNDPQKALVGMDDALLPTFKDWWVSLSSNVPKSISQGISIGVGTDSGFPPTLFGQSVWREMQILNKFGMPWAECYKAVTMINSKIIGDSRIGNLSVGSYADFIVFDSDPIVLGFDAIKSIVSVFIGGDCVYGVDLFKNY